MAPILQASLTERNSYSLMLNPDKLLDNLTGQMTAQQLADRTGLSVRDTVLALCTLRDEGRVVRRVDVEGAPVARWRATGA
jgi:predicted Rossmann fold nucleotide-binding protein DprA/Smf involved in DNA uptake